MRILILLKDGHCFRDENLTPAIWNLVLSSDTGHLIS